MMPLVMEIMFPLVPLSPRESDTKRELVLLTHSETVPISVLRTIYKA